VLSAYNFSCDFSSLLDRLYSPIAKNIDDKFEYFVRLKFGKPNKIAPLRIIKNS
jgi:hypothetical protein